MTTEQGQSQARKEETVLLRDQSGNMYGVPVTVMDQFRISPERREQLEASFRQQGTSPDAIVPTGAAAYEISPDAVQAYRLTDAQREALEAKLGDASQVQGYYHYCYYPATTYYTYYYPSYEYVYEYVPVTTYTYYYTWC